MPLDVELISRLRPQNQVHYFPTLESTMIEAARLVSTGAPNGTVVFADEQTKGVGRLGRTWHSEAELGLYSSTILRLPVEAAVLPVVTLALGLATAHAIQKTTEMMCDLRWPNDVLIGGRKASGILAQLVDGCVIAGIGINVNHTYFPRDLRTPATSLRIEGSGRIYSREMLAAALLESLEVFTNTLVHDGPSAIIHSFIAVSSYAFDRRVRVEESGQTGATAGLDSNGFLLVRYDGGIIERVASRGIRPIHE